MYLLHQTVSFAQFCPFHPQLSLQSSDLYICSHLFSLNTERSKITFKSHLIPKSSSAAPTSGDRMQKLVWVNQHREVKSA